MTNRATNLDCPSGEYTDIHGRVAFCIRCETYMVVNYRDGAFTCLPYDSFRRWFKGEAR